MIRVQAKEIIFSRKVKGCSWLRCKTECLHCRREGKRIHKEMERDCIDGREESKLPKQIKGWKQKEEEMLEDPGKNGNSSYLKSEH